MLPEDQNINPPPVIGGSSQTSSATQGQHGSPENLKTASLPEETQADWQESAEKLA